MRVMDTDSFLTVLCELAREGKRVCTVVSGGSMLPFLSAGRDYVYLEKPEGKLRKGDLVLFRRTNGEFVLHRIKRIKGDEFYLIGDRQYIVEGPVRGEQILAVAVGAKRKGKELTTKSPLWVFYSKVWINTVFLRPFLFRLIGVLHKNKKA
ncbi:MAG: S24/S26 family peptidase [Ruminococcus sp.]|nr:S24/S26 family peptidase [Ruminococcus sp.]